MSEPTELANYRRSSPKHDLTPCPAKVRGPFLGARSHGDPEGKNVTLNCGGVEGHEGLHEFRVRWSQP